MNTNNIDVVGFDKQAELERLHENDIVKKYDEVFRDMVKCRLEDKRYEEDFKLNVPENVINKIAYRLIYKNEYLWEVINEIIDDELNDYIEEEED